MRRFSGGETAWPSGCLPSSPRRLVFTPILDADDSDLLDADDSDYSDADDSDHLDADDSDHLDADDSDLSDADDSDLSDEGRERDGVRVYDFAFLGQYLVAEGIHSGGFGGLGAVSSSFESQ